MKTLRFVRFFGERKGFPHEGMCNTVAGSLVTNTDEYLIYESRLYRMIEKPLYDVFRKIADPIKTKGDW